MSTVEGKSLLSYRGLTVVLYGAQSGKFWGTIECLFGLKMQFWEEIDCELW